jgi:hypothetical protein
VSEDPYRVLGLPRDADEATIRAAWLRAVRDHPPERDAAAFERIRNAFDALRDPRQRIRQMLESDPSMPLARALFDERVPRPAVGPGPWLSLIRGCST